MIRYYLTESVLEVSFLDQTVADAGKTYLLNNVFSLFYHFKVPLLSLNGKKNLVVGKKA